MYAKRGESLTLGLGLGEGIGPYGEGKRAEAGEIRGDKLTCSNACDCSSMG